MSKYLDADMLEKDGWSMERTRRVSSTYMLYEKKKPTDFPAADVEEVKHGKWISVDSYSAFGGDEATWMAHGNPIAFYYCSECKEQAYAGENGESLITPYCPNCGAKME